MKKVQFLIEDNTGHSTIDVPENKVQEEVEKQLDQDKWVTTEKENGETEILTKEDMTLTDDEKEWAEKFDNVKTATITSKAKGG